MYIFSWLKESNISIFFFYPYYPFKNVIVSHFSSLAHKCKQLNTKHLLSVWILSMINKLRNKTKKNTEWQLFNFSDIVIACNFLLNVGYSLIISDMLSVLKIQLCLKSVSCYFTKSALQRLQLSYETGVVPYTASVWNVYECDGFAVHYGTGVFYWVGMDSVVTADPVINNSASPAAFINNKRPLQCLRWNISGRWLRLRIR